MVNSCAYMLVVHGSRSYSYKENVNNLEKLVKKNLDIQGINYILAFAYLELSEESLGEQIVNFAKVCQEKKYNQIKILPLFLLAGNHVKEDIPHAITQAIKTLELSNINIKIEVNNYLGSHHEFIDVVSEKNPKDIENKIVLIAHGTNLKHGNKELINLAQKLGYELAFWSISPNLNEKINILINEGYKNITIMPYFLFTGKITQIIADQVAQLQKQYRHINFILLEPISAKNKLAKAISQILLS